MAAQHLRRTKARKSYLELLKADPKLVTSFIARYLVNMRLVTLIVIGIISFGIFGLTSLPRRVNPEVEIPIVFVSTVLPGASPEDVESLLTIPLEDAVQTVSDIDTISSSSRENLSTIIAEFESSVDSDKAKNDIQSAIDSVSDLPEDATEPFVMALDFEDVPVWTFAVTTEKDLPSLFRFSDELKDKLEAIPQVNNAIISGLETQEIQVLISPEAVEEYGLDPFSLGQAVKAEIDSYPGGTVLTGTNSFSLAIDPLVTDLDTLRQMELSVGGQTFALGDVAQVMERASPDQAKSYYADSQTQAKRVVTFSVFKLNTADIDATAELLHQKVDEVMAEYENQFEVISILDSGQEIQDQFADLGVNLQQTIALVFLTLFVFLGIKQATIASFSIPLTFLIAFGLMMVNGLTLNFLTMFSLLLALGLVVDDAIVIISAMTSYYRTGKFTTKETGVLVWRDFIVPIWTTTITTVWAFIPLLLSSGIIGEFIRSIPIVVTYVLLSSTSVAVLITLPLMMVILKPEIPRRVSIFLKILMALVVLSALMVVFKGNPLMIPIIFVFATLVVLVTRLKRAIFINAFNWCCARLKAEQAIVFIRKIIAEGFVDTRKMSLAYERFMELVLESKYLRRLIILTVVIFFIFAVALIPLGYVKNIFFPKTNEDNLYISVELPLGTNLETTDKETLRLLEELRQIDDDVEYVIAEVGAQAEEDSTGGQVESNLIRYSFKLKENRQLSSVVIAENLRDQLKGYQPGKLRVIERSGGPPAGADVQIRILGDDLGVLNEMADKLVVYLENEQPGVTNVEKSIKTGASKLAFVPNREKMAEAGVDVSYLGGWLRTFASGFTLDEVKLTDDETQQVNFRTSDLLQNPEAIGSITLPAQSGPIPLMSLGELKLEPSPTLITREDDQRTISVSAAVISGYNAPEISGALERYADTELGLPPGYDWATGGANEENQESVNSILQAMLLAFILILGTMVVQLRSYRKALIVLLVIPLAMSGVFVLFALTGIPLSFPALIGVLALFGIVVNNSIVVVEKINQNLRVGIAFKEAIADASASRLEPIMFSSLTTIMGLVPITLSDELWRGLGGAIIAGLSFSGVIMLLFIPVMYYVLYAGELEETKV